MIFVIVNPSPGVVRDAESWLAMTRIKLQFMR